MFIKFYIIGVLNKSYYTSMFNQASLRLSSCTGCINTVYRLLRFVHNLRIFRRTFPDLTISKVYYRYFIVYRYNLRCIFQYCLWLAVFKHECYSFLWICRIYRYICSSCLYDSINSANHLYTSVCYYCYKIIRLYTNFSKLICKAVCSRIQFCIGQLLIFKYQSNIVRCLLYLFFKQFYYCLVSWVLCFCCVEVIQYELLFCFCNHFDVTKLLFCIRCYRLQYFFKVLHYLLCCLFLKQISTVLECYIELFSYFFYIESHVKLCNSALYICFFRFTVPKLYVRTLIILKYKHYIKYWIPRHISLYIHCFYKFFKRIFLILVCFQTCLLYLLQELTECLILLRLSSHCKSIYEHSKHSLSISVSSSADW